MWGETNRGLGTAVGEEQGSFSLEGAILLIPQWDPSLRGNRECGLVPIKKKKGSRV